ncbi:MAG: hypothetical protein ACN4GF_09655 [Lentimonas sp.]
MKLIRYKYPQALMGSAYNPLYGSTTPALARFGGSSMTSLLVLSGSIISRRTSMRMQTIITHA